MVHARVSKMVLVLAPLLAVGCQSPDVGEPCTLAWGQPPAPTATSLYENRGSDYFESGNLACDGLVCIVSPAAPESTKYADASQYPSGYCSKPCVSNSDCYQSKTDLECRQMVLDPVFLQQLDAATRDRYLSDIQYSSYCAIPLSR